MVLLKLTVLVSTILVSAALDADVLILGAGSSGLTAAKFLASKNVSFLIIEGSTEFGGRVRSKDFGGIKVEMGSAAFHGTTADIQAVAKNLTGKAIDYESVMVKTSTGTAAAATTAEADAAWKKLAETQIKTKKMYEKIEEGKHTDMSMRIALERGKWFPKTTVEDVIEVYDYDYEFSKIPEEMSTLAFEQVLEYQDKKPHMSTDPRGFQDYLKRMAKEFMEIDGADSKVKYGEVVDKVTRTASQVSVRTKGGKTYTGKYAILTFSMGVLKSRDVEFEPELPSWKWDPIFRTSMDQYTQIYVTFASKFWTNDEWILHANPRRGYYPIIFNMEAPGFHPAGTNMLMFTVVGEEARRVERSTDAEVLAEIKDVVKGMYGAGTPEPTGVLVTKWLDDPLARGSFTSRQVGDNNERFRDALSAPVGRLYFAGEAYHKVMDGYVQGALVSGANMAEKLYKCMEDGKMCKEFDPNPSETTQRPVTCDATSLHFTTTLCIGILIMKWLL